MAEKGRPTLYTAEIATEVCRRMANGESLRKICRDNPEWPAESTIRLWAVEDREGFSAHYARACEAKMEYWADDIVDISDNSSGDTNRDKLRVDTRKWLMARMAPRRYGDRVTNVHEGGDKPIQTHELSEVEKARSVAFLLASGARQAKNETPH